MIGLFNENFPPILDGVSLTMQNYAYWLNRQGEDVRVVTAFTPKARSFDHLQPYPIYRYTSIPIFRRPPYRLGLPHIDVRVIPQVRRMPFDIIHAHCPFSAGILGQRIAARHGIPFVATFHSKYRTDLEGGVRVSWAVDKEVKRIVQFYERADEVWIPQASMESTLREYGYRGTVQVVENGNDFVTDVAEYQRLRQQMRRELGVQPHETMLLFVGQHIWAKNIALIIDSLARLKGLPWKLFLCGTGNARLEIAHKIESYGLQDQARLLGLVSDRSRLKAIDAAADLFLFPSLYDNAPLVVREAAALRTPSVMIAGSTAAGVISDGDNGFLTTNDVDAYASLVKHLIENSDLVHRVGVKASTTLTRSWENIVLEVRDRYKDICHRYSKRPTY